MMTRIQRLSSRLLLSAALMVLPQLNLAAVSTKDDTGKVVELTQPVKRIVSLAPHTTEMLFAAGAGDRIVGTVSYSDYPPAARDIPQVGSYKRLDFERIAALQPDLIVGWSSGNPGDALQQLRRLGFPVYVTEPRKLDDIATNIERLAHLTGTPAEATKAVSEFREGIDALAQKYENAQPVTLFYQVWNSPLTTLNGEHLFSQVVRLCGGRNVFADLPALAPRIDVEAVLARDPQTIIASGMGDERPEWLDDWKRWTSLQAVKRNHLYFVHPDLIQRHTPRILQGAEILCSHLDNARRDYYSEPAP
jgi:iron complex transport system substrate-binding protein